MWQQQQLAARQMVLQQQALAAKSTATKVQREVSRVGFVSLAAAGRF